MNDQAVVDALTRIDREIRLGGTSGGMDVISTNVITDNDLRMAIEAHPILGIGRVAFSKHHQINLHPGLLEPRIRSSLELRGPSATLEWLLALHRSESFVSRRCAQLIGVSINTNFEFANGVRILPLGEMRDSFQMNTIISRSQNFYTAYVTDSTGLVHFEEERFVEDMNELSSNYDFFLDTAIGLTIGTTSCPVVGTCWSEYETEELKGSEIGWSFSHEQFDGRPPDFQTAEVDETAVCWTNKYLLLPEKVRRICRIAASRLNLAQRRRDPGDQAIDTCIALEALLSQGSQGELTYRLKLRAALLLGTDLIMRKEISGKIGELYRLRGKVVHGDQSSTPDADREIAKWGIKTVRQLIRTVVDRGEIPDLQMLELVGRLD